MKGCNKMKKRYVEFLVFTIVCIILIAPSLISTLYTFPVQDDFHYAFYAKELMNQGHNIFTASLIKTWDYYTSFCGCYTSSFLGYFYSGIINCNIAGIRIFCFTNAILFYIVLYIFALAVINITLKYSVRQTRIIYIMLLLCISCVRYYMWHEDFNWFITSVQYLLILQLILLGISCYIYAIKKEQKVLYVVSALLGFLGSGAALNIAVFCCIAYFIVTFIVLIKYKKKIEVVLVLFTVWLGVLINVIAPGNFLRYGEPMGKKALLYAVYLSAKYVCIRLQIFFNYSIFVFILIAVATMLFFWPFKKIEFRFPLPVVATVVAFGTIVGTIFPVMFGYGWDVYRIISRCNFISDMVIYFSVFAILLYWRGWVGYRFPHMKLCKKSVITFVACVLTLLGFYIYGFQECEIAWSKQVRQLNNGEYSVFSNYWTGVYNEIESKRYNEEKTVNLYRDYYPESTTSLVNPQFYVGYYDGDIYGNTTIARFYNKDAVYLYCNR